MTRKEFVQKYILGEMNRYMPENPQTFDLWISQAELAWDRINNNLSKYGEEEDCLDANDILQVMGLDEGIISLEAMKEILENK